MRLIIDIAVGKLPFSPSLRRQAAGVFKLFGQVKARIKPQDLGDFSNRLRGVSQTILVPPVEKLAERDSAYLDVFNRLSLDRNRSCAARSALRLAYGRKPSRFSAECPPLFHPMNWSVKVMIQSWEWAGTAKCVIWEGGIYAKYRA